MKPSSFSERKAPWKFTSRIVYHAIVFTSEFDIYVTLEGSSTDFMHIHVSQPLLGSLALPNVDLVLGSQSLPTYCYRTGQHSNLYNRSIVSESQEKSICIPISLNSSFTVITRVSLRGDICSGSKTVSIFLVFATIVFATPLMTHLKSLTAGVQQLRDSDYIHIAIFFHCIFKLF